MFTGIVQAVGEIILSREHDGLRRIGVRVPRAARQGVKLGASVSLDGVCLTVVRRGWTTLHFDLMSETLRKTTFGDMGVGSKVNVERSFKVGDEIGGHIVSGHVEGVAEVVAIHQEGGTTVVRFQAPAALVHPLKEKGFVALNGASLTVTNLQDNAFDIFFIPATLAHTTFGKIQLGDKVNIETWQPK